MLIVVGCFAACAAETPDMELIVLAPDGRNFIERESGRTFIPFGTNYYDPNTGWAPKIWRQFDPEKVQRHFSVMSGMGVNCARVFLTAATFSLTPGPSTSKPSRS